LYSIDHEPLEYILWYVEYGGLRFHVNKNTIIPRPETEYMIESVREYIWANKYILVDVGTWSWVLWLSILHSHGNFFDKAFLIDISEDALAVAQKNYDYCLEHNQIDKSVDVMIEKGNLFSSPDLDHYLNSDRFLPAQEWQKEVIVLANLPYIPDETFDTNPDLSIKYEPRVAFVWWDDGLDLYRIMFAQICESGCQFTMFLEMMTWQVDVLRQEFSRLVFEEIKTFHFQIRIVRVVVKN
jgi:release factor glutamine methyltransferase